MNRIGYLIQLDGKDDYEYNIEDEYLIFETLEQVRDYCLCNSIDLSTVNVVEVELEN